MIDVTVQLADYDLSREALAKAVAKINKAALAYEKAKAMRENMQLGIPDTKAKPEKVEEGEVSKLLKDFGISDVKAIIKANSIKIGVGNGQKPDEFYFQLLSKESGLTDMVKAYKVEQLGGYD